MPTLNVVPAYGRDYRSKKEIEASLDKEEDFQIQDVGSRDNGRYVNKQQLVGKGYTLYVRYKKLANVAVIKIK